MKIEQPKILCLFSAPLVAPDGKALAALDVEAEREAIVRELSAINRQVSLRIGFATVDELSRGISDGFNILHFSGHGHPEHLLFEDGKGGSHPVKGEYLKRLIETGPFELAIVSACHSEAIGKLIVKAGVRHVVAIRCDVPVLDLAAITFIGQFFRNLFRGESIKKAFEMAKLLVEGNPELEKIKPELQVMALIEGEKFVAEEEKFVLLPDKKSKAHLHPLISKEIPEGTVSIEAPRISKPDLPVRPQSFTGRSKDIHILINKLLANRFVTVTGAGGIGKTTLATEVARWFHSRAHFPDGIFIIDLRHAESASAIIDIFGAAIEETVTELKQVINWLRDRQCLLLIDNAEDVLWHDEDAVRDAINHVLKFAPHIKLFITSQRSVGGNLHEPERLFRLYPFGKDYSGLLFLATAKRAMSKDEWDSDALQSLLDQCGGHPLSLVLMARQLVPGTTLEDLVERIKTHKAKAIAVKNITDRDPEHGESLVASLSSAFHSLSDNAKTVFQILSTLPAGAQEFTVKQIYGDKGWEYAQEICDASLAEITPFKRVILLPPVRLFSASVLKDEVKQRYGSRILELMGSYAEDIYHHHRAADAKAYRKAFAVEEPNFRFAVELPCATAASKGCASALGTLAPHLIQLYIYHERLDEAEEVGGLLLSKVAKLEDTLGQAHTISSLADLSLRTAQLEEAKVRHKEALAIFREFDYELGEANTLKSLGDVAIRTGDLQDAKERYEGALGIYKKINEKLGEANTIASLGELAANRSEFEEAKVRYEEALQIYKEIGDKLGEANTLFFLGSLSLDRDEWVEARVRCEEALGIYREIDDSVGEANVLLSLGKLAQRNNEFQKAKRRYEEVLRIDRKIDEKVGLANALLSLGYVALRTDELEEAKERYEEALGIYLDIDAKLGEAHTLRALGDLALRRDELAEAKERYEGALGIFRDIDEKLGEANTLQALGDLALRRDELAEAKERYEGALGIYRHIDEKLGEANTLTRLGEWLALKGNLQEADNTLDEALGIYQKIAHLYGQSDVKVVRALVLLKREHNTEAKQQLSECSSIRDKVRAHGEAAQWLIFYADHLKSQDLQEGAKICLEYAEQFASKAKDARLQEQVEKRLSELG